jgi:hypothetical protein
MSLISDIIGSWRDEVTKMLPPSVRMANMIDWFASLVSPIQTGSDNIDLFEIDIRRRMKYNGQIMVLQASLNEIFGITVAPFIRVETNLDAAAIPAFFYNEPEGIPTSYFYNASEIPDTTFFSPDPDLNTIPSFRVLIPSGIYTTTLEENVRTETQLYKIAGKLFTIIQY